MFDDLVTRYGALHDDIIRFERATEKGQKKKADTLKTRIRANWEAVKDWQKENVRLSL